MRSREKPHYFRSAFREVPSAAFRLTVMNDLAASGEVSKHWLFIRREGREMAPYKKMLAGMGPGGHGAEWPLNLIPLCNIARNKSFKHRRRVANLSPILPR